MDEVRIGMAGYAFMGKAHSNGWRQAPHFFPGIPRPRLQVICGRDERALKDAAAQLGWQATETDWRTMVRREDVDVVDIVTPGDSHAAIAIAAAEAGKHVICEKPLANSLAEAQAMLAAAQKAKVRHMVLFNYRRVPALALARQMIAEGRLGRLFHFRAQYLQDWIVDPQFPRVWRLDKAIAGAGALGDLGAHIIDLAHYLAGPVREVRATTVTMITERPLPGQPRKMAPVTVDDAATFFGTIQRQEGEVTASFEVSRLATGRKNYLGLEINGSQGSLRFNLERQNELEFYDRTLPEKLQGWNNILVTEASHPYIAHWWPAGHMLGYEHAFVHACADFLAALKTRTELHPDFADGVACNAVLDAVERSAQSGKTEMVPH